MKVGDRVRVRLDDLKYSKESFKVVAVFKHQLLIDVTNNSYGLGWSGRVESNLKLNPYNLYWYTSTYIKANPKLFI